MIIIIALSSYIIDYNFIMQIIIYDMHYIN